MTLRRMPLGRPPARAIPLIHFLARHSLAGEQWSLRQGLLLPLVPSDCRLRPLSRAGRGGRRLPDGAAFSFVSVVWHRPVIGCWLGAWRAGSHAGTP
jgi:hypothetical protein